MTRAVLATSLTALLAACGGGAKNVDLTQVAPPSEQSNRPTAPEAPRASLGGSPVASSVAGGYQLPAASVAAPLPGGATRFVFVGPDGTMRVGRDAAYADARFAAGVAGVIAALAGEAATSGPRDGEARTYRAIARRTELATIGTVLVLDRAAPAELAARLAAGLREPVVLAVDGGVMPFAITAEPGEGGGRAPVAVAAGQTFSSLVSLLDAAAVGGASAVELRVDVAGGGPSARSAAALTIAIDTPRVTGGLDAGLVGRRINGGVAAIRACAEKHLLGDAAGTVAVRFVVGATGAVTDASASGPPGFDGAATCIARATRALELPRPRGGTADVSYQITFGR